MLGINLLEIPVWAIKKRDEAGIDSFWKNLPYITYFEVARLFCGPKRNSRTDGPRWEGHPMGPHKRQFHILQKLGKIRFHIVRFHRNQKNSDGAGW